MLSKVLLSFLATLLSAQLIIANPQYCPSPENAKNIAFAKNILVAAPTFGRTDADVLLPANSTYSCVSVVGLPATGISVSMVIFGFSDVGVLVRIVSRAGVGIDHDVLAYTE